MTNDLITSPLVPQSMDQAMRLAEIMANSKMVPDHMKGDIGTCFMVIEQATRWRMSPFSVAQGTSNIKGKLMYEGKVVASAAISMGAVLGDFDYRFTGDEQKPEGLSVEATATRASDRKQYTVKLRWSDAKTDNQYWRKQPAQQLCYAVVRVWCRRYVPGVMLGVYAPEEIEGGVVIDAVAEETPPDAGIKRVVPEQKETPPEPAPKKRTFADLLADLNADLLECSSKSDITAVEKSPDAKLIWEKGNQRAKDELSRMFAETMARIVVAETPHDPETGEIVDTGKLIDDEIPF